MKDHWELSLPGLKHRLRSLEKSVDYNEIGRIGEAIRDLTLNITDPGDLALLQSVGFKMPRIDNDGLFIPSLFSNLEPITNFNGFRKIVVGHKRERPPFPEVIFQSVSQRLGAIDFRLWAQGWKQRLLPRTRRADLIARLRAERDGLTQLHSKYQALFERCAEPLRLGLENRWPNIIACRIEIAAREAQRESDMSAAIFSPVPPSAEEILRARVAAADKKSRDQAQQLYDRVPRTHRCPYCDEIVGHKGYHLDHIVPVARGGLSTVDNLVYICVPCNLAKRDRGLLAFARSKGISIEPLIDRLHKLGKHV